MYSDRAPQAPHPCRKQLGQSLIELIVGIGIGVLFITAAIGIITVALRIDFQNTYAQTASELAQEMIEQVGTFANADWHNIDSLPSSTPYSLATSSGFFVAESGSSTVVLGNASYDVSFMTEWVYRTNAEVITTPENGSWDPSTLKIVVVAEQTNLPANAPRITLSHYLTRIRDRVWIQTNWANGSSAFIGPTTDSPATGAFANATNTTWNVSGQLTIADPTKNLQITAGSGIDPAHHYAWNDVIGWIDFIYYSNVSVGSTISGYASSSAGDIALDCSTTPNGNICVTAPGSGVSEFKVSQDVGGILSGFAWSDSLGWISFNCSNMTMCVTDNSCPAGTAPCSTPSGGADYHVYIDGSGFFHGVAWNDAIGWISFNSGTCDTNANGFLDSGLCGGDDATTVAHSYSVKTGVSQVGLAELDSMIFDTSRTGGAGINTIMWKGSRPSGTRVAFQIASSNCTGGETNPPTCSSGTWSFIGPNGTNSTTYEPISYDVPLKINRQYHNNHRYIRYRAMLYSDAAQTTGPTVNDIILNWSH